MLLLHNEPQQVLGRVVVFQQSIDQGERGARKNILCGTLVHASKIRSILSFVCVGQVATAYGLLSDPAKRHKYDVGGFDSLEQSELQVEVDPASLNIVGRAVAAIFSKMGNSH